MQPALRVLTKPIAIASVCAAVLTAMPLASAATVTPYEQSRSADCGTAGVPVCSISFPQVPAGSFLDLSQIGCDIKSTSLSNPAKFDRARVTLRTNYQGKTVTLPISTGASNLGYDADGSHAMLSVPVVFHVSAQQRATIAVSLWPSDLPISMTCAAIGTMTGP